MNTKSSPEIIPLDHLASLTVTGHDATRFLHAQFTNDLEGLEENHWQYSGYCTPKGRLLAFMVIVRAGENAYRIVLDRSTIETFVPRLRMFVLRDDVSIEIDDQPVTGTIGGLPDRWPTDLAPAPGAASCLDDACILTIDKDRFLAIGLAQTKDTVAGSPDEWIIRDIKAGIPTVTSTTQETFVPQMVNLDLIGAVNFKKGCYPGQEVVARVHYLGKTKQRMFLASTSAEASLAPGDRIFADEVEEKPVGTVVSSAHSGDRSWLLAVLQTHSVTDHQTLHAPAIDGAELTIGKLPYAIPELETEENG